MVVASLSSMRWAGLRVLGQLKYSEQSGSHREKATRQRQNPTATLKRPTEEERQGVYRREEATGEGVVSV